jgi:hypothetical protein
MTKTKASFFDKGRSPTRSEEGLAAGCYDVAAIWQPLLVRMREESGLACIAFSYW